MKKKPSKNQYFKKYAKKGCPAHLGFSENGRPEQELVPECPGAYNSTR